MVVQLCLQDRSKQTNCTEICQWNTSLELHCTQWTKANEPVHSHSPLHLGLCCKVYSARSVRLCNFVIRRWSEPFQGVQRAAWRAQTGQWRRCWDAPCDRQSAGCCCTYTAEPHRLVCADCALAPPGGSTTHQHCHHHPLQTYQSHNHRLCVSIQSNKAMQWRGSPLP